MREFLMLAHNFEEEKHSIGGWFMSEKLDGMRAFWDGGLTRGKYATDVEWANTEKHTRYLRPVVCTGLWSRYGQVIHAPDWFLDDLPNYTLDGELYAGRGNFQKVMSTCKQLNPNDDWKLIHYKVFDRPALRNVLQPGKVNNVNFKKVFKGYDEGPGQMTFRSVLHNMDSGKYWNYCHQVSLPYAQDKALEVVEDRLREISAMGGEGLMLRKSESEWTPMRTWNLLKVKPVRFGSAVIVGWTEGKGKYKGMVGALKVRWEGKEFELSGMSDEERIIGYLKGEVGFKYRELTDSGIPKEARYVR